MGDLAEAERVIEDVRERADKTAEELIALQEQLNLNAHRREAFLRAGLQRDLITTRREQIKGDLTEIQEQLHQLTAKRTTKPDETKLELVSCEVLGGPVKKGFSCVFSVVDGWHPTP